MITYEELMARVHGAHLYRHPDPHILTAPWVKLRKLPMNRHQFGPAFLGSIYQAIPEPGSDVRKWEVGRILRFAGYNRANNVGDPFERQGPFKTKEYLRVLKIHPKKGRPVYLPLGAILVRSLRSGEIDMVFSEEVTVARTLPRRLRVCAPLKLRPRRKR